MIHQWEVDAQETYASERAKGTGPTDGDAQGPKDGDAQGQKDGDAQVPKDRFTSCKRGIKNSDARIMSALGSSNASTGRFDIQGKCQLADGTIKTIGILGFVEKEQYGERVWNVLLKTINDASGMHTKGEMMILRDEQLQRQGNLAD